MSLKSTEKNKSIESEPKLSGSYKKNSSTKNQWWARTQSPEESM